MSKVMVTGANGFIGKHLVRRLKSEGHNVVEVNRNNFKDLYKLMRRVKYVYHLGANVPFTTYSYDKVSQAEDVQNMFDLVEVCNEFDVKKIIYPSGALIRYSHSVYADTKIECERILQLVNYATDSVILRFPGVYGQGQRETGFIHGLALKSKKQSILKDVDKIYRNYINIGEALDVLVNAMKMKTGTYDIIGTENLHVGIWSYGRSLQKTIYFDFDGTLVNTKNRIHRSGKFEECQMNFENDELFEGTIETLKELKKRGYRLILITKRSNRRLFLKQVKKFKLDKFFDYFINTNEAPKAPFIEYYHNGIMVGDTEVDIEAGNYYGMTTIAVTSGARTAEQLKKYKPTHTIKDITKIFKVVGE